MAQQYTPAGPGASLPPLLSSPPAEQVRGPGRGRGGGGGRQRRNDNHNVPSVRPARQTGSRPTGPPQPTHLATTSTPERNDPLWMSNMTGYDLQPLPNVECVYSGAEVLPVLTNVLHKSLCAQSPGYSRRVPESALSYYAAALVYARMLWLQGQNGFELGLNEDRFVDQVQAMNLEPPMLLAHYLAGFGNTRVPSGRDLRFRMPPREYVRIDDEGLVLSGWFGQVSAETQPLYQNYPCLAVYAYRVLSDASRADFAPDWTIPDDLHPDEVGGDMPTTAMLGYARRARLSEAQRSFYSTVGIDADEQFPVDHPTIPLCTALLLAVQCELRNIQSLRLSPVPTSLVGSQGQLGLVKFEDETEAVTDKSVTFQSPLRLPGEVVVSASSFMYRCEHKVDIGNVVAPYVVWNYAVENAADWAPYLAASNTNRTREPNLLQIAEFRSTPYLIRTRLEALERALSDRGKG